MTSEENKILVRRYYEEVVNTGNVDRISEYVSPAYVEVYNGTEYSMGLEGAKEHVLGIRKTLHLTKPFVTHLAFARSAPIVFAGEANVL